MPHAGRFAGASRTRSCSGTTAAFRTMLACRSCFTAAQSVLPARRILPQSWRNCSTPMIGGTHGATAFTNTCTTIRVPHEVLGIARGHARVRFGGNEGKIIALRSGDVVILPAGTGHQRISASKQLLVVGAYPPSGTYDECIPLPEHHDRALKSIPNVPTPAKDPVYGRGGPLQELWRRT